MSKFGIIPERGDIDGAKLGSGANDVGCGAIEVVVEWAGKVIVNKVGLAEDDTIGSDEAETILVEAGDGWNDGLLLVSNEGIALGLADGNEDSCIVGAMEGMLLDIIVVGTKDGLLLALGSSDGDVLTSSKVGIAGGFVENSTTSVENVLSW